MNHMWAPWRMDYVSSPKSDENIFETKIASKDDRKSLVLFRGNNAFVLMNLYPYNNGHLLIAPYRKVNSMEKLDSDESSEIMKLSQESMRVLRESMDCALPVPHRRPGSRSATRGYCEYVWRCQRP